MSSPILNRLVRRETHSPRTTAMVIAVLLALALVVYLGVEVVLHLAGQAPAAASPGQILGWVRDVPILQPQGAVIAGAIVLALLGLVFVILAITPGRLAKHGMQQDRAAVIVDNGVIAASLAQHLSDETGLARSEITVGVGHRSADVTLRPTPGVPIDRDRVRQLAAAELDSYRLTPPVTPRVSIIAPRNSDEDR